MELKPGGSVVQESALHYATVLRDMTYHSTKMRSSSSATRAIPGSRASAPAVCTLPSWVYHKMEGILKSPFSWPGKLWGDVRDHPET